jgi:hypothetical protein
MGPCVHHVTYSQHPTTLVHDTHRGLEIQLSPVVTPSLHCHCHVHHLLLLVRLLLTPFFPVLFLLLEHMGEV